MDTEIVKNVSEVLSVVSAWAVSLGTILALLSTVCKPIHNLLAWIIKRIAGERKANQEVLDRIDALSEELSEKIDGVSNRCDELSLKITEVENGNNENEKDRLRAEIFRFGNYARKGAVITGEEFRSIQRDFQKYTRLGGNDIAHDEYTFIEHYYNTSGWNAHK